MAAIVTGLIPLLRTAVDSTTTYKCRSLWFGFLCVRLVVLFMAQLPWTKLDSDFSCNSTKDVCTRACYNQHFDKPAVVAWNFLYVLVLLSVLLMELFSSHLRTVALKRSSKAGEEPEAAVAAPETVLMIDLHKDTGTLGFYLLSVGIRILVEGWFIYVLLFWNLPKLDKGPFRCQTDMCKELHLCVVRAAPEKRMSVYALASISSMVIVSSVLFCLYSVVHYLCKFRM